MLAGEKGHLSLRAANEAYLRFSLAGSYICMCLVCRHECETTHTPTHISTFICNIYINVSVCVCLCLYVFLINAL